MKKVISLIMACMTIIGILSCTTFGASAKVITISATVSTKKYIKLNLTSKSLYKGKSFTLNVKKASHKKLKTVKWTSTNSKVASVNSKGKVTAKKAGTCQIVATSKSNKKVTAKCKVKVMAKTKNTISKDKWKALVANLKNSGMVLSYNGEANGIDISAKMYYKSANKIDNIVVDLEYYDHNGDKVNSTFYIKEPGYLSGLMLYYKGEYSIGYFQKVDNAVQVTGYCGSRPYDEGLRQAFTEGGAIAFYTANAIISDNYNDNLFNVMARDYNYNNIYFPYN